MTASCTVPSIPVEQVLIFDVFEMFFCEPDDFFLPDIEVRILRLELLPDPSDVVLPYLDGCSLVQPWIIQTDMDSGLECPVDLADAVCGEE
jgi:hypothetical protein